MAVVNPPGFLQNLTTHTAEILRGSNNALIAGSRAAASLVSRGGVHPDLGGFLLVTQNGSPNMSVNVASGIAYIPGTEGSKQGTYVSTNDATLNVSIAAADPSNPRIDLIVYKVQDAAYSGAVNSGSIVAVTGTPAGSPSAPATPSNALVLAQIAVSASDTSIVTGDITDRRTFLSSVGGIIRCTTSTRPGIGTVAEGQVIYETNTDSFYYTTDTGTTWLRIATDLNQGKGVVGGNRYPGSGTLGGGLGVTENTTNFETATVSLEANRRYKIVMHFQYIGTNTGDVFQWKIRETSLAGASLSDVVQEIKNNSFGYTENYECEYTTTSAVSRKFLLTVVRISGSGTVSVIRGSQTPYAEIHDLGPSSVMTTL